MSRKPYIKIVYPDASQIAMLLTEAMVHRASGKRVVETESSERESTGQDLFASSLCCVTETSVELTLNLAPEAMDFALATLITKNLTQPELDQAMAASDSLELDALFSRAQAAEAPGQALDGDSSADVPSAEREATTQSGEQDAIEVPLLEAPKEEKIEIGKISEMELRDILLKLVINYETADPDSIEPFDIAIAEIKRAAGVVTPDETCRTKKQVDRDLTKQIAAALNVASLKLVTTEELKQLENFTSSLIAILIDDDEEMQDTYIRIGDLRKELIHARYFGGADANKRYIELQEEINPNTGIPWSEYEAYELRENKLEPPPHEKIAAAAQEREKSKKTKKSKKKKQEPTWEDVEAEARQMQAPAPKQSAASRADEEISEIDKGLLNDIDTEGEDHAE